MTALAGGPGTQPGEPPGGWPCQGCGRSPGRFSPVSWSPAFGLYQCAPCRAARTGAELHATERANAAARLAARGQ